MDACLDALPPENVTGHTKKVHLLRSVCDRMRERRTDRRLRILDVGCGSGYAVTRFLGRPGDSVLGIDLYQPSIAYATRNFARPGLTFQCRSAESLCDTEQHFDVIVLADILEHLAEPAQVLTECRRLMTHDGCLIVTVPNGHGPFEIESALSRIPVLGRVLIKLTEYLVAVLNKFGPWRGLWSEALSHLPVDLPYNDESKHVKFFTRRSLTALLQRACFRIGTIQGLSFLAGPFTNFLFGASRAFCVWNTSIAGKLPLALTSAWFIECTSMQTSTDSPQKSPAL